MRNFPRRSFSVEAKSGGRRTSTIIPTRVVPAQVPPRPSGLSLPPATVEPVAEKRRVLPSLIVPDLPQAEPEPMPATDEPPVRRPRGRPRKVLQARNEPAAPAAEMAAPVLALAIEPQAPVAARAAPRKRKDDPSHDLPRGERWKTRRLGRWSR